MRPQLPARLALVFLCIVFAAHSSPVMPSDPIAARARAVAGYGALPLHFEANQGLTDPSVDFLARGAGYSLFLTHGDAVFRLAAGSPVDNDAVVRIALAGARKTARPEGREVLSGASHYFLGNDAAAWRENVAHYARVEYPQVYPGVDLVYYGNQKVLEFDFVVAPGRDPDQIRLAIDGVHQLRVDQQGDLVLTTGGGDIVQHRPVIYQDVDGARRPVDGGYRLLGEREVGFDVSPYDTSRALVIDPVLAYSTYLGGNSSELDTKIAVDSSGNAYVSGTTQSTNFPLVNPIQTAFGGGVDVPHDAFVTKLNPSGTALVYSTYLGGSGNDRAFGIAVDSSGNAYVTGHTTSSNFVTTAGAFQTTYGGFVDAFVTKLNPVGSLAYSTYLGTAEAGDTGFAIALDASGNAYVVGETGSSGFPTTAGVLQPTKVGGMFLTKLNATGSALVYSTFMGGTGGGTPGAIVVDAAGNAYVGGATYGDYPTTAGAFQTSITPGGFSDAFVTKVNAGATALDYSTYLGGSENEYEISGIAVDASGNAFVTGRSRSTNFPTTAGVFQMTSGGQDDVFVTKFNSTGSNLVYSTLIGGSNNEFPGGVVIDASGNAYIAGSTSSTNFPIVAPSQAALNGFSDAFVAELNPAASALVFSTFFGGGNTDSATGISIDASGSVYVTGNTSSSDFPVTSGVFQSSIAGGGNDAFIAKFGVGTTPTVLRPPTNLTAASIVGNTVTITFTAPIDSITPTGYVLEGGLSPGSVLASVPTGSTATTFTFTAPTGAFYIRVHSVAGTTKSVASNEIRIFVNVPAPPSAPANLTAVVNGSALSLAWINTSLGGAPTGMFLDVTGSVTASLSLPVAESASFSSVPAGTYTLSLRAANATGVSTSSNSVTVTVPAACSGVPATPTSFTVTKSGNVITASWGLLAGGPAPTGYTVSVTGTFSGTFAVTSRSISGAVGPGTYTLSVVATNPCGASAPAASQTITIP